MPLPFPLRKQLHRLQRTSATWQLGALPDILQLGDGSTAHIALCAQGDGKVRAVATSENPPDLAFWEGLLVDAMSKPMSPMSPQRPAKVRLADATCTAALAASLQGLKIGVESDGDLTALTRAADMLAVHMSGGGTGAPDQQRELNQLAAAFTRIRPWRDISSEEGLQLTLDVPGWTQPVAVVMGSGGETYGLALYRTGQDFETTMGATGDEHPDAVESLVLLLDDRIDQPRRRHEPPMFGHNPPDRTPRPLTHAHHARALASAGRAVLAWVEDLRGGATSDQLRTYDGVGVQLLAPPGWPVMEPFDEAPPPEDPADRARLARITLLRDIERVLATAMEPASERRPNLAEALDVLREADERREDGPSEPFPLWIVGLPWLVHDVKDEGESLATTIAKGTDDEDAHHWIDANRRAVTGVWQVRGLKPGVGLWLRDIGGGDERFVVDAGASRTTELHSLMYGRVATVEGEHVLVGTHPITIPGECKELVAEPLRKAMKVTTLVPGALSGLLTWAMIAPKLRASRQRALSELQPTNHDGDPLLLVEDRFTFEPEARAEVLRALEGLEDAEARADAPGEVVFVRADDTASRAGDIVVGHAQVGEQRLTLMSNSERRADTLRARVEAACGERLRRQGRSLQDPTSTALPEPTEPPYEPSLEEQQVLRQMRLEWLGRWPDESLPALDGKSLRQAARLPKLRGKLEALFEHIEVMESRVPAWQQVDLAPLRAELGLPPLPGNS